MIVPPTVFAVVVGIAFSVPGLATEYLTGIVTKGTFLLSETANVQRENHWYHGLVGYLPIGTRLYFVDQPITLNNLSEGVPEHYYKVASSIGIGGLLLEDRFIGVKDNPIAVVVSSEVIALHNPNPKNGKYRKLLTIGRYDGAYLQITDMSDPEFFSAILHRTGENELPQQEPVRVWRQLIDRGLVVVVNPARISEQEMSVPVWDSQEKLDNELIDKIRIAIAERIGVEQWDTVKNFLNDANTIQCLLSAEGRVEVGFTLFSNGLSFNLDLAFKEQDHMFRLHQRKLKMGNDQWTYLILQNVKCDQATPVRLQQLTLQEGAYDPNKRALVRLKDWEQERSNWVVSLSGNTAPFRMIRIDGESAYLAALRRLDKFVQGGESFIRSLEPEKKQVLLNLILREIAYFEHRELVAQPNG